jgi:hypothetical protein
LLNEKKFNEKKRICIKNDKAAKRDEKENGEKN